MEKIRNVGVRSAVGTGFTMSVLLSGILPATAQEHGESAGNGASAGAADAEHSAASSGAAEQHTATHQAATHHGGEHHHESIGEALLWPSINFALYLAVMTYCVRKMLNPALRKRAAEVESLLDRASRDIADAGTQLKDRELRKRGIAQEQQLIRERLEQEGQRIAEEVVRAGEQAAQTVRSDVQKRIEQELKRATADVRAEVVAGASTRAREILRSSLSREDDNRLRQEAINGLFE